MGKKYKNLQIYMYRLDMNPYTILQSERSRCHITRMCHCPNNKHTQLHTSRTYGKKRNNQMDNCKGILLRVNSIQKHSYCSLLLIMSKSCRGQHKVYRYLKKSHKGRYRSKLDNVHLKERMDKHSSGIKKQYKKGSYPLCTRNIVHFPRSSLSHNLTHKLHLSSMYCWYNRCIHQSHRIHSSSGIANSYDKLDNSFQGSLEYMLHYEDNS